MKTSSLAPVALAAALLLSLSGCTPDAPADDTSQSSADGSTDQGTDEATDDTSTDDSAASDLAPVLTDAPPAGGPEMQLSADAITPSELSTSVGDVVTFTSDDGSFHGLLVNQLSSVTVADNLPEYYLFETAGTYLVADELSDATATITVE